MIERRLDVFGIGMQEVLLILIIGLVVIGPKKLPEVAKALGKGYGEFRRAFEDMKSSINVDIHADEEKERIRQIHDSVKPPSSPLTSPSGEEAPVEATAGEASVETASPYPEVHEDSGEPESVPGGDTEEKKGEGDGSR